MNEAINIHSVSQLFPPTKGNIKGKCVVCGRKTEFGNKIDFSDNFTLWSVLYTGTCICEYCYTLCRNQQYRYKSWVATKDGINFITRKEVLETLLNPPEPPFAIYITKTGKKQGFIKLNRFPALSRDHYYIAFDDSLIFIDRKKLQELVNLARYARKILKFNKSDLINPSVRCWEYKDVCEKILKVSGNPMWEVVVYAID